MFVSKRRMRKQPEPWLNRNSNIKSPVSKVRKISMGESAEDPDGSKRILQLFSNGINTVPSIDVTEPLLCRDEELEKLTAATEVQEKKKLIDVAVTGMPGVGKTQLIYKFITNNASKFHNIIWISNFSFYSRDNLINEFQKLGKLMNILCNDFRHESCYSCEEDKGIIVSDVYNILSKAKTLIVFDDVAYDIFKYLPPAFVNRNNFMIVVTSICNDWECDLHIPLQCFPLEISEQFLVQNLENCSVENAQKLAQNFDNLPLALQNLVLYFKNKQKISNLQRNTFCVDDLVHETILTEEFRCKYDPGLCYEYKEISLLGETRRLNSICSTVIGSLNKFAILLLKYMSYLEPNQINISLFTNLKYHEDQLTLYNTVILLKKYSLLTGTANNIQISTVISYNIRNDTHESCALQCLLEHFKTKIKNINETLEIDHKYSRHVMYIFNEYYDIFKSFLKNFDILFLLSAFNSNNLEVLTKVYDIISKELNYNHYIIQVDGLKFHTLYLELCRKINF